MTITRPDFFVLSPEHKGDIRKEHAVKEYRLEELHTYTREDLRWITEEEAIFQSPYLANEKLFRLLQADKMRPELRTYGAIKYLHMIDKGSSDITFALLIPEDKTAKNYLYYTGLHALWEKDFAQHSILEAEKKVYHEAKRNWEDISRFIRTRIGFFEGMLAVAHNLWKSRLEDIQSTLKFLHEHK